MRSNYSTASRARASKEAADLSAYLTKFAQRAVSQGDFRTSRCDSCHGSCPENLGADRVSQILGKRLVVSSTPV